MASALVANIKSPEKLVSESSTFQTDTGSANATEALAHIFRHRQRKPDIAEHPVAVIIERPESGSLVFSKVAGGAQNHFIREGALNLIYIKLDRFDQDAVAESEEDFCNSFEGLLGDLAKVAGVSDNIAIVEMSVEIGPQHIAEQDAGEGDVEAEQPFWSAGVLVSFNPLGDV